MCLSLFFCCLLLLLFLFSWKIFIHAFYVHKRKKKPNKIIISSSHWHRLSSLLKINENDAACSSRVCVCFVWLVCACITERKPNHVERNIFWFLKKKQKKKGKKLIYYLFIKRFFYFKLKTKGTRVNCAFIKFSVQSTVFFFSFSFSFFACLRA